MKRWSALALLVLVGMVSASCNRTSARSVGRLTVEGRAEVATVDGSLEIVTRARTLKSGEQVKMLDGTGVLSLGGGRQLELRKDSVVRLAAGTGQGGSSQPRGELVRGQVLVTASGDAAVVVAGDSTIRVTGSSRVFRDLAVVTGVYQGAAGVETAGRSVSVPALRQVTVPAPGVLTGPAPLSFSPADPWDQRFLGDAIDVGDQLAARSRGFSAQLPPGQGTSVEFFQQILPALRSQPFDGSLLSDGLPPGETLVGAAITLEGSRGTFAERWANVFLFHRQGAPWGLVALDQAVGRGPLLAAVDAAIGRATGVGTQAAAAPPAPPASTGSAGSGSSASSGGSGTAPAFVPVPVPGGSGNTAAGSGAASGDTAGGGADASGGGAPSSSGTDPSGSGGSEPPSTLEDRGPVNLGIPLVDDTVNAVVDALSGLLRAIGRE